MPKPTPLDVQIEYAADDSCQIRLWSRGTHDAASFRKACASKLLLWDERQTDLTAMPVTHGFSRRVRAGAEERRVCDYLRIPSVKGPGAFAVTELSAWLPL